MAKLKSRPFSAELQLINHNGASHSPPEGLNPAHPAGNSGQAEILAAIAALREELFRDSGRAAADAGLSADGKLLEVHGREIADARILMAELDQLRSAIDTTKTEIACMRYKDANKQERIVDVTHELDEVVMDTERATENILGACEAIETHIETLDLHATSGDERAEIAALGQKVVKIYEACNFQDITGQRITKVVNTLKFIEQRLEAMMRIWGGEDTFAAMDAPGQTPGHEDELLLNGPARSDAERVSQDDIDALFA